MAVGCKISPSLICMDFLEIGPQIRALNRLADLYHCDMADGHFVPAFGLPFECIRSVKAAASVPVDVHLMVENVESVVERLTQISVDMVTLHIEAIGAVAFRVIGRLRDAGVAVGVALNPVTTLDSLSYVLPLVDKVSVLTFDPGIAGQKLVKSTLQKVAQLARIKEDEGHKFDIEVDGSCNERNFTDMRLAGANQFVVGTSGLFSLDADIGVAWKKMKRYMGTDEDIYRE